MVVPFQTANQELYDVNGTLYSRSLNVTVFLYRLPVYEEGDVQTGKWKKAKKVERDWERRG